MSDGATPSPYTVSVLSVQFNSPSTSPSEEPKTLSTISWAAIPWAGRLAAIKTDAMMDVNERMRSAGCRHCSPMVKVGGRQRSGSVSRVLSARRMGERGDHSSGTVVTGCLVAAYPGVRSRRTTSPPLFGLAPDEVYPATSVTEGAVSSYLTISPLPANPRPENSVPENSRYPRARAVYFLWHFLWGRPPWELPSIPSCGARTFLTPISRNFAPQDGSAVTRATPTASSPSSM